MRKTEFIAQKLPSDITSVLDVGGVGEDGSYQKHFKTTVVDVDERADVVQNLNKDTKLHFKNNSFDLVVLSQILEHLAFPEEVLEEAKRVAKKYILIGLPNDLTLDNRMRFLFGKVSLFEGIRPYDHKYIMTPRSVDDFVMKHFKKSQIMWKWNMYGVKGGRILPFKFRNFLAKICPNLFAKEVFYLIKK